MIKELKLKLTGISPLILHSGEMVNPQYWATKAIKQLSGKRKKTEADLAEIARLEFLGSLYVNEAHQIIVPDIVLTAALTAGAKVSKRGQHAKAAMFVSGHSLVEFPDAGVGLKELYEKDEYKIYVPVKVGQAKVMRMRPIFHKWGLSLTVQYNDSQLNEKDVYDFAVAAGAEKGIGDWRPQHGRFVVEKILS